MSQAEPAVGCPADLIALSVTEGGVRVQRPDAGGCEVASWERLPDVLTAHPAATFVVEDAGTVFGRLLAGREEARAAAWPVLDGHRVLDLRLAIQALRLVGRRNLRAPDQDLRDCGAQVRGVMADVAQRFQVEPERVERFGLLGHGLRVRARAALGALAEHPIQLAPGDREELIRQCRARVEALERAVRRVDHELGGHLGRVRRRPDGFVPLPVHLSNWLYAHLRRLKDAHGAAIGPFLGLTNEVLDFQHPQAWPLWALGAPAVPRLAALAAAARLWHDLVQGDGAPVRPTWDVLPRFRVSAFDFEALPGVDVGRFLGGPPGTLPVRVSFRPLVSAAVATAVAADRHAGWAGDPLGAGPNLVETVATALGDRLPAGPTARQRADGAEALVRYMASAGGQDGLKEYVETVAGVDTPLFPGDYAGVWRGLCQNQAPALGAWSADGLIDWVERSLPNPPALGTLRTMVTPQAARSRAVAESFADPAATWGAASEFRFYRLAVDNPQWQVKLNVFTNRGPLNNYRAFCTRPVVSPAGLVRPHLPWWANRAEAWRVAFDEAALNVITRLAAAGHQLAWASDRGVWLNVPMTQVDQDRPRIEQLANEAASEILRRPCHLSPSLGADA